jgi:hypothetical protein
MRFKTIEKGKEFHILALLKGSVENSKCPVDEFCDELGSNFEDDLGRLQATIEEVSDHGTDLIPHNRFHLAKTGSGIYRFAAGRLRIYCFFASSERLIICSHGNKKSTQSTDNRDLERALNIKAQYEKAASADIRID